MKKALLITISAVMAIFLILSVLVLMFNFYDGEITNEYVIAKGLTNKEISKNVMEQQFDYYKSHGLKTRISDYKINSIVMGDEDINKKYVNDKDGFVFYVSFDIKPFFGRLFDYWYAGNGNDKDGWCVDKIGYYMITVENDVYCLDYIGTMC